MHKQQWEFLTGQHKGHLKFLLKHNQDETAVAFLKSIFVEHVEKLPVEARTVQNKQSIAHRLRDELLETNYGHLIENHYNDEFISPE